jgi:dienelactone hydrolase
MNVRMFTCLGLLLTWGMAPTPAEETATREKAYRGEGDLIFLRDFGSDDVGYLAVPELRPDYGIVLVHGWTGLCEGVRRDCDYLAEQGNIALAVDLFNGVKPKNDREARIERGKLEQELVVTAIRTGANFFKESPRFQMDRVVVVACQQSALAALEAAQQQTNIMAVILIDPEPALSVEQLLEAPVPVRVIVRNGAALDSYIQLVEADAGALPASLSNLVIPASPVWINSWRNRRMNPELWAAMKAFLDPLEARRAPLTKRLIDRVF